MEDLTERRALVERRLEEILADMEPADLETSIEHVTFAGGKRVRPAITILTCEALGSRPEDALDFAAGIELVHTASLVVDDIIDESTVRRGVESAWSKFGVGPAIIASDGLLGEAFELFSADPEALRRVSEAMVELGQGEATELVDDPTDEAAYRALARRKTGALFRAAAELGAIAAGRSEEAAPHVGEFAERVGIAFQIRDDVLDATADAERLGKPTGRDRQMERPSLLEVTDLDPAEANAKARQEAHAALSALEEIELRDPVAAEYLSDLASFVVERER